MIIKTGKLYINGKQHAKRYDKNENFGYDTYSDTVKFFEILKEFIFGRFKITISCTRELRHQKDFITLSFDPPLGGPTVEPKDNNAERK